MRKGLALSFGLFFILCNLPSRIGKVAFILIDSPIKIISPKNTPPHYAFTELKLAESVAEDSFAKAKFQVPLQGGLKGLSANFGQKLIVSEMIVAASKQQLIHLKNEVNAEIARNTGWVEQLPYSQKIILENAKDKGLILNQEWNDQSVRTVEKKSELSLHKHRIKGPIEISGGLALTNNHTFEVRRMYEGVPRESGYVNPKTGEFFIEVSDPVGDIVASLRDHDGKILGEGTYRISEKFQGLGGATTLPTLLVSPIQRISGRVFSINDEGRTRTTVPISNQKISFLKHAIQLDSNKKGEFSGTEVNVFSTTLVKAQADNHWSSSLIATSGFNSKIPLFSKKMVLGMKSILELDPKFKHLKQIKSLIWGQILHDGKPVAGVQVAAEDEPTAQAIYLNELFLPDVRLRGTSKNGYYIIVNATEGYHSLLASRADSYFGHVNVVVDANTVSIGNIQSSMKINSVPIRVFDAFEAIPLTAKIEIQSLAEEVSINGQGVISLPNISREGLLYPEIQQTNLSDKQQVAYISGQYFYNDYRGYLHIPMVKESWLDSIISSLKINLIPETGIIIGFVPEENFEVFLAEDSLDETEDQKQIYYFDSSGKITDQKSGTVGGGFIIFGAQPAVQEVVVLFQKTGTLSSKVVPVSTTKVSVLGF